VNFSAAELIEMLDAIERFKAEFPVLNLTAGLREIRRHLLSEHEVFPCVGGYKYFYINWNLNVWRCEAWAQPIESLETFDSFAVQRDHCTACTISCYRDTSVLMHAGVAALDAVQELRHGWVLKAMARLFQRRVAQSAASLFELLPLSPRWHGEAT
jgi:hypothetical protein